MKITLIMLPGESHEIECDEHEKLAGLLFRSKELNRRLVIDLGKNLAHKQIQFAIRHKDSEEWTIFPLYQACIQILQEGDTIMYSMLFGD